ncbi:MAG: 7-cyano-7-deazaguanine synthase QueC [Spirochaetota bacterium]
MKHAMGHALVVFSGGQDSTTCLGWAKNRAEKVDAITFSYGQRHAVELTAAKDIAALMNVPLKVVIIDFLSSLVTSALLSDGDIAAKHPDDASLPASFVPNRNALFLTLAHAYAQTIHADTIVAGMCETDYSGYPDCRREFIDAMERSLSLGSNKQIPIVTPLMYLTKAETFKRAETEGVLDIVIAKSHTCYEGDRSMHDWGYGCGQCPACVLRKNGFDEFVSGK